MNFNMESRTYTYMETHRKEQTYFCEENHPTLSHTPYFCQYLSISL